MPRSGSAGFAAERLCRLCRGAALPDLPQTARGFLGALCAGQDENDDRCDEEDASECHRDLGLAKMGVSEANTSLYDLVPLRCPQRRLRARDAPVRPNRRRERATCREKEREGGVLVHAVAIPSTRTDRIARSCRRQRTHSLSRDRWSGQTLRLCWNDGASQRVGSGRRTRATAHATHGCGSAHSSCASFVVRRTTR
jgi:hypothetical protein